MPQRRSRRRSPSTSPERPELQASPPRIVTEPVFVPEPDEVREVASHADSDEDLQAVLNAVAEQEAEQGDEARQGGAEGDEALTGGAETIHRGDGAPRGGAENADSEAAAPRSSDAPPSEFMQINLDDAPAASAPHAAPAEAPLKRASGGASSLLSGLTLEQRREMFARLSAELSTEMSQITSGNSQHATKNKKNTDGNPPVPRGGFQPATGRAAAPENPPEQLASRTASASENAVLQFTAGPAVSAQRQNASAAEASNALAQAAELAGVTASEYSLELARQRAEYEKAMSEGHPAFRLDVPLQQRLAFLSDRQTGKEKSAANANAAAGAGNRLCHCE